MYVSDSSIFPPSSMRVRISNMEGLDYIVDIKPDLKVDELKIMSLSQFSSPAESMKGSLYHKLLLIRNGRILTEDKSVMQEGIQNNDELLLLKKRLPPLNFVTSEVSSTRKDDSKKVPTTDLINKLTSTLPKPAVTKATEPPVRTVDFQTELRKILVSLIEASQKILGLNPEASKIFKQAEEMFNEPSSSSPEVDESAVKQLTDMGFPENRARKALLLNDVSVIPAMEWLIQHESDPDIDTPLPGSTVPQTDSDAKEQEGATGGSQEEINHSQSSPKSKNILQSLRAFRKREFRPNQLALQHLIEMGFEEKDAVTALRIARNSQDDACEWLLGDRKTKPEEVEEGLDTNGAVYKAIMANPQVQLGLNNPRCLLAFLHMLDSPYAAQQWLSDPETGPLLVQVSRIYHAEKHAES